MAAGNKLPWFRLYTEMPTDPKIRRLRKPEYKWLWTVLMCFARMSPEPGYLLISDGQPVDPEDIADIADLPIRTVNEGMKRMETLGLLVADLDRDTWLLPAFSRRQFKSDDSTARTRQWRQKQKGD